MAKINPDRINQLRNRFGRQAGSIKRCGEITKNEFDSSIFVGKPVYVYIVK